MSGSVRRVCVRVVQVLVETAAQQEESGCVRHFGQTFEQGPNTAFVAVAAGRDDPGNRFAYGCGTVLSKVSTIFGYPAWPAGRIARSDEGCRTGRVPSTP